MHKKNSLSNLNEWESGQAVLKSYPRMIFIEFTRSCNLYCGMCRSHKICSKDLFMPQNILDKIEEEIVPFAECIDVRGWGESTLDNRLLPFIQKYASSKQINLYTNLNSRNVEYWEKMASLPINIIISIESAIPSRYALFRRGGNYQRLMRHLLAIKDKTAKLYLAATVMNDNLDDLHSLVALAKECQAEFLQLSPISRQNPNTDSDYPLMGVDLSKKLNLTLQQIDSYAADTGVQVCVSANLETLNNGGFNRCIHPWSYCYFRYDGGVGFCDHLLCKKNGFIGNLNEFSFLDIWNSEYAQFIRKCHVNSVFSPLVEKGVECDWCYKNRYANFEFLIHDKYRPLSLREYLKKKEEMK